MQQENPPGGGEPPGPRVWPGSATKEEIMALIQSDPRTVPSARDERIIRRIMRLTLYTLAAMVLALASLVFFGA